MSKPNNTVTEKIDLIKRANNAYRIGNPIISDTEYDNLLDELKVVIDKKTFDSFRETLTESAGNVTHFYKMGSLDKIKAFDSKVSIKDWLLKNIPDLGDGTEGVFVSSKIDGCSSCLHYVNGQLVSAATRGDGIKGVDILHKVSLFAPNSIGSDFTGYIRGEVTLTYDTFDELCEFTGKPYKNLRNATAGLINSVSSTDEEVSFLRFFPYEIMGETGLTKKEQFKKLKSLGFTTALYKECTDIYNDSFLNGGASYDEAFLAIYNGFMEEAPFDIDGLVVSDINDDSVFEDSFLPTRTVAVKFNQLTAETRLIDITWNLSKNGTYHPVGIVDTVNLGGANVSNVTLNNLRMIEANGLKYGCNVTIVKSGDIIPKLVSVEHPHPDEETDIELPKFCSSCGHELVYEENALFPRCVNEECDEMLFGKIHHMLKQLEIKHVSMKTIKKFKLYHVDDLINIKPDGGAVKDNFIKDLNEKMFGASKEELLAAFDYDGVSTAIIEKLINHYGFDKLVGFSSLSEIQNSGALPYGVGVKFVEKFFNGFQKNKKYFDMIVNDSRYFGNSSNKKITVDTSNGVLKGAGFVVTGELNSMSRGEFKQKVITNGGLYQSSVSKKTSYLVTNETTRTTKMKKAEELGVKVINESDFLDMLENSDGLNLF